MTFRLPYHGVQHRLRHYEVTSPRYPLRRLVVAAR